MVGIGDILAVGVIDQTRAVMTKRTGDLSIMQLVELAFSAENYILTVSVAQPFSALHFLHSPP
jgi:hypothetical protein